MRQWKEYKLKDLCSKIGSGATPSGGSNSYKTEGISLIRSQNILDFKFSYDGLAFIDEEQAERLKNVILKPDDILLNITGDSVARVCKVPVEVLPARVNQHVSIIRPDEDKLDNSFLLYYLQYIKPHLLSISEIGGTRNAITKVMIENLDIPVPELRTQYSIASILSSLDDKIDLLHRQNATLEALAETLFRQWFVEEAEESWEKGRLGDFMDIKHGYAFKGKYITPEETDKILVTPGNFKIGGGFSFHKFKYYSDDNFPESYILNEGDFIVTMTDLSISNDSLGYPAFVPKIEGKLLLHNQRVGKVIIKKGHSSKELFLYHLMKTQDYRHYILGSSTGTNVSHTSPTNICNYEFTIPEHSKIKLFCDHVINFQKKERQNINQIQVLTHLRDTLLPKLMSGEVRVSESLNQA